MPGEKYIDFGEAKKKWQQEKKGVGDPPRGGATFDTVLKGRFDDVPEGSSFQSMLEGVQHVVVVHPEKSKILNVVLVLKDTKQRYINYSLDDKGVLRRKDTIPRGMTIDETVLLQEIIENFERINLDFFRHIDHAILPQGEVDITKTNPSERKEPRERIIDTHRIERLREKANFGGISPEGLHGYYVFVFDHVMVCENPTVDNAAYFIDIPKNIPAPRKNASGEEKDAFFKNPHIKELLQKDKQIHKRDKNTRIYHSGNWEERMDKLLAEKQASA